MEATVVLPENQKMKVKYDLISEDIVIEELYYNDKPVYDLLIALNILYEIDLTERIFSALEKKHSM